MRKNFLYLFLLFCCNFVYGRQPEVSRTDSLGKVLANSRSYKDSAAVMMELCNHLAYLDSAQSMKYARRLMSLYQHHHDQQGIGVAHYYIAGAYMDQGKNDLSASEFKKAKTILEKDKAYNAQHYLARVWHNLGAIRQREGDPKAYVDILLNKAIPILEAIKDTATIARNYNAIGGIFVNTLQFDKSLSYYRKSIQILEHLKGSEDLALAYLGAARSMLFTGDFSARPARQIKLYLDKAENVLKPNPKSSVWVEYYTNVGLYYLEVEKNHVTAIKNYDSGLALAAELGDDYLQLELMNRKYYLYDGLKQYPQARETAYRLYKLASKFPISKNILIILKNLVNAEENNGNKEKAFELLKQYTTLADSLRIEETNIQLNELEKKYEQQNKEKKILQLQTDNKLKSTELKLNKSLMISISALLIVVIIVLGLLYLLQVNRNKLSEKNKELHQEQVFFDALIQGQEQERKRLAGDLHDGLGGLLSNIKLLISNSSHTDNVNAQKELVLHKMDDAVNELRRIARNLMPETLLRFGLVIALRDYCEDLEKSGVKISLQTYGMEAPCDKGVQIMIYRILQELISNAVKHAEAKAIIVQCMQNEQKIFITVEDDGKGYDPAKAGSTDGLGLSTVRNRVAYLKGTMDIQTEPNVGTTINIELNECKSS